MTASFTQILNITRSGMMSRLLDLDTVSNNLANINTVGFKQSRSNFQELLSQRELSGTQIRSTQNLMDQGSIQSTDNSLDLAIQGEGFFAVKLPNGTTAYSRDGQFFLDANRQIVTASGFPLVWSGQIPENTEEIHVNPDGSVMTQQDGAWSKAGNIQINRFPNPSALIGYGQNMWLENDVSGQAKAGTPGANGYGTILGSAVEESNVNMAEQMTEMTSLQRSFEMSLHTFQQTDDMLSQAIHMRKG
jgi:flagellar basal-body rod protein FlgG